MKKDHNPFPATAVARLSTPESDFWSIETEALKQARSYLSDYIARARKEDKPSKQSDNEGMVLAIVGDYGTGKTHIAQDMLRQIASERNSSLHPLYLDAPSDTFLSLYRDRFLERLNRAEVIQRVDEYYADIVADELGKSDLTKSISEGLRNRSLSPDDVVHEFGLMESQFIRKLDKKLKSVTEQSDFGTALLLLRRPEFQAAVWEWLKGESPDPILQERGITRTIDNDAIALEAIGVMAFLFGQQQHRFILFVDEIEKVLSTSAIHQPDAAGVLALKKLMESMSKTRALLVLIGLPEFQDFIPEDARQRIACIIRPSAVTSNEISEYIREANRRAKDIDSLAPFTDDSIDYIAEIAGGNTRKMVRLCYHAYHKATVSGTNVNRPMLREIAREQFESTKTEDVNAEITRYIESRGWLYEKNQSFDSKKSKLGVDFWLPIGEEGNGILVWVTPSILQKSDVTALTKRSDRITNNIAGEPTLGSILVINGYLADNLKTEVENAFDKVIIYHVRGFREDLESILLGVRARIEQQDRENVLAAVHRKVDEISRQNGTIDSQLSTLLNRGINRNELQPAIILGLRSFFGQLTSSTTSAETNYPLILAVFDDFKRSLNEIQGFDNFFDLVFGFPDLRVHGPELERLLYSHRASPSGYEMLRNSDLSTGLNDILLAKAAYKAFQRGIFTILSRFPLERTGKYLTNPLDIIEIICMRFDRYSDEVDFSLALKTVRELNTKFLRELRGGEEYLELLDKEFDASIFYAEKVTADFRHLARNVYYASKNEMQRFEE